MLAMAAMQVAQYLKQRAAEKQGRQESAASILNQNAQSRGATPYGYQAVTGEKGVQEQSNQQSDQFGQMLSKYLNRNSGGGGSAPVAAALSSTPGQAQSTPAVGQGGPESFLSGLPQAGQSTRRYEGPTRKFGGPRRRYG